jgi:hypothetical protein
VRDSGRRKDKLWSIAGYRLIELRTLVFAKLQRETLTARGNRVVRDRVSR